MAMKPDRILRMLLAFAVMSALSGIARSAAAPWKPDKNVEIIVGTGAGGGQDKTARTLNRLLADKRLVEVPITVVNKPGGGGAVGWSYLNQHAGDAHYVEIATTTLLTNQITGRGALGFNDVTPLAMLLAESVVIAVREESPLKSGKDLVERLKKDASSVSVSIGSSVGGPNHIAMALIAKAAGGDAKKLKTVVFQGGGEAITATLGGHVDVISAAGNNVIPFLAAGKMRVLGVAAPRRLAGAFANVPTWKEQSIDVEISNWRMVAGPKGLSAAQVAYWESAFARLVQTEEWKKDLEQNLLENTFMNGADSRSYLKEQYEQFRGASTEVGLAR
jgi:putative tricarboxylic transport membrane protein